MRWKIDHENNNLLNKIIEIELKPSKYSVQNLKTKICPPFNPMHKTFSEKIHNANIENENIKLYKRLVKTKSNYKAINFIKCYERNHYYENLINKNSCI